MPRIGIFAGTFDPVHKGHIQFALSAAHAAQLDKVYLLPEIKPRGKTHVSHIAHRIAMLKLATRAHPKLEVLELPNKQFSIVSTLPRLLQRFPDDQLVLLLGSDVFHHLRSWPSVKQLLHHAGAVVAVRNQSSVAEVLATTMALPTPLRELHIIESPMPTLSSQLIRQSIGHGDKPQGVPASVKGYIDSHWLYVSTSSLK